jgi:DNA-binding NtrC family response regulator
MASILVIDDEPDLCVVLQDILESVGHRVVVTTHVREMAEQLEREAFDLLIADIVMPGQNGVEIIKETRARFPAMGIIAMSGDLPLRRELYFEAGAMFGADASFVKPFGRQPVLAGVEEALKQAALRKNADSKA